MVGEKSFLKRVLSSQWSFFWAGITFGVAQIVYMIGLWVQSANTGKEVILTPITVTTDLGNMFRGMEVMFYRLFDLPDFELYGESIEGVAAAGGAFVPGIGWPIVGMIVGGWLVALMERENRAWAHYPTRMLVLAFVGGAIFSYGTRLAGGCTLNHLLGGIPLMNIHSIVTVVFMGLGGGLAFLIMSKVGAAPYFKHQETRSYVCGNDPGESVTCRADRKGSSNPLYWLGLLFALLFAGVAVYGGLFNPESLQHLKNGELVDFGKSVSDRGLFYVALTLGAGIIGGIGLAKSGFGTECALVAWKSAGMMTRKDAAFAKMGVPRITRTLMRSYLPLIGIFAHWVVLLAFVVLAWILFDASPGFVGSITYQLTVGNLIGGLLLGMGAVMLVGCEVRSYMRLGMGYLNTMVGFMGFAFGYLPFTLNYQAHQAFFESTLLMEKHKVYDLIFPNSLTGQQIVLAAWWLLLLAGLFYFIKKGSRNTGASQQSLVRLNTEDLQNEIDELGSRQGGRIGDVEIPAPVPVKA